MFGHIPELQTLAWWRTSACLCLERKSALYDLYVIRILQTIEYRISVMWLPWDLALENLELPQQPVGHGWPRGITLSRMSPLRTRRAGEPHGPCYHTTFTLNMSALATESPTIFTVIDLNWWSWTKTVPLYPWNQSCHTPLLNSNEWDWHLL